MTIQVILLDNRYENDDDSFWHGSGDRLGADQWLWFDLALQRGKARNVTMTVIGSGIQMVSERAPLPILENYRWKNRERLYQTLKANEAENVVLISGDVHFG